jgi:hypothetical protein
MAANTDPVFTKTAKIGAVTITSGNPARDGSGTVGTVITGATDGTRIHRVTVTAMSTVTGGMIRMFLNPGTGNFLYKEVPVTASVATMTVAGFTTTLEYLGERALILPSGCVLGVSTEKDGYFNVFAEGGDY